ncbi:MAG: squalene--hopene cyclase [Planctomycetales bacterium]|nr:squalene--hopene cyclase [Planctomycetales bacterium]
MYPQISAAYRQVRDELLAARGEGPHWTGQLSVSALSTATATSALAIYESSAERSGLLGPREAERIRRLRLEGIRWLAARQNPDGGWGDTSRSHSNLATTMLVRAAFQLNGAPASPADLLERADQYIAAAGGEAGLRRQYGPDKTFAVPILANCALAGTVPWRRVPPLPFEWTCLPQSIYGALRLPVVSYAIPALVAVGLVRFRQAPPRNPLIRWLRHRAAAGALQILEDMLPDSGGFLEATPLTSFVVMSLCAAGENGHRAVRRGIDFLCASVQPCGGWPIDTNLATWVTTLSINALAAGGTQVAVLDCHPWLLDSQHRQVHPSTGAAPGGWAWTDRSGGVPDVDDTAGALLALSAIAGEEPFSTGGIPAPMVAAAEAGVGWLLGLQNRDGGWPTFCCGWGKLPFDRSGSDLTAHALRALHAWRVNFNQLSARSAGDFPRRFATMLPAIRRGFDYLQRHQQPDGSWIPLWFGNQDHAQQWNPVYGTSRVLLAYRDLDRLATAAASRGFAWLRAAQRPAGDWGSVEETSLAIEALLADPATDHDGSLEKSLVRGLQWLVEAIERGEQRRPAPIGFYFARLWYYETLYPLIFATSALGQAARRFTPSAGRLDLEMRGRQPVSAADVAASNV